MTTTFPTTHKDHALSRADNARRVATHPDSAANNGRDVIFADTGSALVHALLAVADAVNDHARDTR